MYSTIQLAIVIPTLNAGLFLSECLASISNTLPAGCSSIPILILDGGSQDNTHSIVAYYTSFFSKIEIRVFPRTHPAQRINLLIESGEYDYLMMCHADDIYDMGGRLACLDQCINRGDIIRGSQVAFFESPLDKCSNLAVPIYSGLHLSHPLEPDQIALELCHWWAVSLNTVSINSRALRELGLRYDWQAYSHCADYYLNWQIAKLGRISNSPAITTLTRHNGYGDGPLNYAKTQADFSCIKEMILSEAGILDAIGNDLALKLLSSRYAYGVFADCGSMNFFDVRRIRRLLQCQRFQAGMHLVSLSDLPLPSISTLAKQYLLPLKKSLLAGIKKLLSLP